MCDHLCNYDSKDVQLRVHYLSQLVALEESCVEAVELAELLMRQGVSLNTRLSQVSKSLTFFVHSEGKETYPEWLYVLENEFICAGTSVEKLDQNTEIWISQTPSKSNQLCSTLLCCDY